MAVTRPAPPKNGCSSCGYDFGSTELFVLHRRDWKIVRTHTTEECKEQCHTGTHPRGECQKLVGKCLGAKALGLVGRNGAWYTVEGAAKYDRMAGVRAQRGS